MTRAQRWRSHDHMVTPPFGGFGGLMSESPYAIGGA